MYDSRELLIRVQENLTNGDFTRIEDLLEIAAVLPSEEGVSRQNLLSALRLARLGRRVIQLDAEDFNLVSDCPELSKDTRRVLLASSARREVGGSGGQLASLNSTMRLLLEVLQLTYSSDQCDRTAGILHLMGEYLPLLAWQEILGNAGEPASVRVRILQGDVKWVRKPQECPRGQNPFRIKLSVERVQRASGPRVEKALSDYMLKGRNSVADLLEACTLCPKDSAADGKNSRGAPCGIAPTPSEGHELAVRMETIRIFRRAEPIRLRHTSPLGHAFSVPDQRELDAAWQNAYSQILAVEGFPLTPADLNDDYVLPGLPTLIGYWAGLGNRPEPSEVIPNIGSAIQMLLEGTIQSLTHHE